MRIRDTEAETHWEGGYKRRTRRGWVYVIEATINGKRFHISTRCTNRGAAVEQLKRFQADPLGYRAEGDQRAATGALRLTGDLSAEYFDWLISSGRTRKHANQTAGYLEAWIEDLSLVDLRHVSLRDHIVPALDKRKTCRGARIAAIKSFYGWLRKERHAIGAHEDPTFGTLRAPQAKPEQWKSPKWVSAENVQRVLDVLEGPIRDLLAFAACTGWHMTEMERFIRSGEVDPTAIGAVISTRHKSGKRHSTEIMAGESLEAIQRLRAGAIVPTRPTADLKAACRKANVDEFGFGQLRHSVATWAVKGGSSLAEVSKFLGHADARTTARFYADMHAAAKTVQLPALRLVKG